MYIMILNERIFHLLDSLMIVPKSLFKLKHSLFLPLIIDASFILFAVQILQRTPHFDGLLLDVRSQVDVYKLLHAVFVERTATFILCEAV
jgi:hypothetical protein